MRVALIGWDTDDAVIGALARLGTEVLAYTRWFPGHPEAEPQPGGWLKHRCPHQLGGGPAAEGVAFGEAVLGRVGSAAGASDFDVVHALDPLARPAAAALRERHLARAYVASLAAADVAPGADPAEVKEPDLWLADHPWLADRWRSRSAAAGGPRVELAATATMLARATGLAGPAAGPEGPVVVIWAPGQADLNVPGLVQALTQVRGQEPRLAIIVLGSGPCPEALRRALAALRLLHRGSRGAVASSPEVWSAWLGAASVVCLAGAPPGAPDDPAAWAAWTFGVPVIGLNGMAAPAVAAALLAALHDRSRFESEVRAGAALAERRLSPTGVALAWLRAYLEARGAESAPARTEPVLPVFGPTRVTLLALGSREAYASWYVRPHDRALGLEWMGADATRSTLALRLADITDLLFTGTNAHFTWDIDLQPASGFRTIPVNAPGRSLVATLGLRSSRGYFHPLAHAGPTHLPREEPSREPPARSLLALPRR